MLPKQAGVARAAASHALERAVTRFSTSTSSSILVDCLVTRDDFVEAVADVMTSQDDSDFSEIAVNGEEADANAGDEQNET